MENKDLKYEYLSNFDREMINFIKYNNVLSASNEQNLWIDEEFKLLAFRKGGLVFLFNFNSSRSFPQYELPTSEKGDYKVVFNSDEGMFGGQSRIDTNYIYHAEALQHKTGNIGVIINTPSRTVLVLKKIDPNIG